MSGGTIEQNGCGKLLDITPRVISAIRELGVTHIWLTGVIEHAHATDYSAYGIEQDNPQVVKGLAGSPYAISDYYDIDPDIAVNPEKRIEEFRTTVKRIHDAGLKVVIDFVPNHVARRYRSDARAVDAPDDLGADDDTTKAFSPDNNFYYLPSEQFTTPAPTADGMEAYTEFPAKASGNDCFSAAPSVNDWYETVKLNYGIDYPGGTGAHFSTTPSTWHKMLHILLYWAEMGVDAFRCDMAHMVPVEFWHWATAQVKSAHPGVEFIAELYDTGLYRTYITEGGFDYLYDKVNLYDTLREIQTCSRPASSLTGCWWCVDGIEDHMLNFLENHDEQRYASAFYAGDPLRAIPAATVAALFGRGAFMLYAGQELGEPGMESEGFSGLDGRTTIFDYWSLATLQRWLNGGKPSEKNLLPRERVVRDFYRRLLGLCNTIPAIAEGGFFDLMYANSDNRTIDPNTQFVFMRHCPGSTVIVAANFGNNSAEMSVNIPAHAFDILGLKESMVEAKDLLSGLTYRTRLAPDAAFPLFAGACNAAVVELTTIGRKKK